MTRAARLVGLGVLAAGCALVPPPPDDPLSADEHNELGVAYHARGDAGRAAREFRRALALRPAFVRARVNLGDALLALGDVEGAIRTYEEARAAQPDDPAIANNLAWALLQHARRWPEAEGLIRAALAGRPEPRGYYLDTLGVLLLRQGEPREALAAFRAALADVAVSDHRIRAAVLRHAGQALARLGDAASAAACERAAVRLIGAVPGAAPLPLGGASGEPPEVGAEDTLC